MAASTNTNLANMWKGAAGTGWVDVMDQLDSMYKPFEELLVQRVASLPVRSVLDVGCGTGATTLAAARQLSGHGHCSGIDISAVMIDAARARFAQAGVAADLVVADAATYAFAPSSIDLFISRFGVMFFDDPVAAFANLRRAARHEARLHMLVWRGPEDNPFMLVAEDAARALLPDLPQRIVDAPDQFGFARPAYVTRVLQESGWHDVQLQTVDIVCRFPAAELVRYFTQLGPVGRALANVDEALRAQVIHTVRPAFQPYLIDEEVRFNAACWALTARAG